jgi:Tol biopolymer transport system component
MARIHRDGRVTTLAPLGGDSTWSRHGLVAYTIPSGFTDLSRVCLRRGATGELVRCFGSEGTTTGDPVWSPDGTRLMLTRTNMAGGPAEVWIVRPDGTVVSRAPVQGNPVPIFSPDARRLAFTRYSAHGDPRLQYSDLHTMRPDGTGGRRIVSGGWAEALDWQPRPGG